MGVSPRLNLMVNTERVDYSSFNEESIIKESINRVVSLEPDNSFIGYVLVE